MCKCNLYEPKARASYWSKLSFSQREDILNMVIGLSSLSSLLFKLE